MGNDYSNGTTGDTLESLEAEREDLTKTVACVRQMTRDFNTLAERRKSRDVKRIAFHLQLKGPHMNLCVRKGILSPEGFQWYKESMARKKVLGEQMLEDAAAYGQALVRWAEDLERREARYRSRNTEQQIARDPAETAAGSVPLEVSHGVNLSLAGEPALKKELGDAASTEEQEPRKRQESNQDVEDHPRHRHHRGEDSCSPHDDQQRHEHIRSSLAVITGEVTADTSLLVQFLETGRQQMMTLAEIAKVTKSASVAIEVQGNVMIDVDGSGPKHGDPSANKHNETSLKVAGKSLNADTTAYAVAPSIMSWDGGNGLPILKGGERATITANGKTIEAIVGDFGPNEPQSDGNTTFGEVSFKAVQDLGILIARPDNNPRTGDYPVTIVYYPECRKSVKQANHKSKP